MAIPHPVATAAGKESPVSGVEVSVVEVVVVSVESVVSVVVVEVLESEIV